MVVVEDAHWFDPSTIEESRVAAGCRRGPAARGGDGPPRPVAARRWPVNSIDLDPLTGDQMDTLIAALDPDSGRGRAWPVADRCDGVPFYVEQVVGGLGTETGVPEGLYEPLLARLRASANVLPVVEAAAPSVARSTADCCSRPSTLSDQALDGVLGELEDARVLERWAANGWRFRHELLREVATELAPTSVRRQPARQDRRRLGDGCGIPTGSWWPRITSGQSGRAIGRGISTGIGGCSTARGLLRGPRLSSIALTRRSRDGRPGARPPGDHRAIGARVPRGHRGGRFKSCGRADFERCLTLGGTDLHDDELFATLVALLGYCASRADVAVWCRYWNR